MKPSKRARTTNGSETEHAPQAQKPAISKHLKNIFEKGELQEMAVVSKMETTAADGKRYQTAFYSLDAIIAVGYRVNSARATQFRIWATSVLKEYILKGFVLDDDRLRKGGNPFGEDYFRFFCLIRK